MDLPTIQAQKAPVATARGLEKALKQADEETKALYALLAGSGLRIGEAMALMVGPDDGKNSFWQPETATIKVRTTVSKGYIQLSPKTDAGVREIDLAPELNAFLCQVLLQENSTPGLLFQNVDGDLMNDRTLYRYLKEDGLPGFHSLRRYRITHLRKQGVPEGLVQFWAGHADKNITDRYDKIGQDIETRKQWAAKAGLGFQLA